MKRNNKKGFTIVELVIVIAVIAVLAGVLVPTFSGIVKNAKESKALQEATNAYKEAYAMAMSDGKLDFLGGQNMFDVFVPANEYANGKNLTQYDEKFNKAFRDQVTQYVEGKKSRDEALNEFKKNVKDTTSVEVD